MPQRFHFDACHQIDVIHEVIEELTPGFVVDTSGADHVCQLLCPVNGQRGDCFVGSDVNADDASLGQVVVIVDDRLKNFCILIQHSGDAIDSAYMGHRSLQTAFVCAGASGTPFNGSSELLPICWTGSGVN